MSSSLPTHLTLGVAGHIDHGKTSLVRALTGVETDRLPEERERGMSIVLGFAPLTLPNGDVIDFIDVPGHERFVGTMISGASGIDALLLVIAATERVMPQTAEHLALATLLGVTRGIVAVTKSDLLDSPESRADSESAIRAYLADTSLADAPLIFTSTLTGEGIVSLRTEIEHLLSAKSTDQDFDPNAPFTLPINRVFVLPGHGTIVTGTLQGGPIHIGDPIEILPGSLKTEARTLQVHGQDVFSAAPGWRVAVNLRGIKKEQLKRGDTLTTPATLRPTNLIDATLSLLPGATLKRGDQLRLHVNTTETTVRAYLLDSLIINSDNSNQTLKQLPFLSGKVAERPDGWPPAQGAEFVQLRLATPIAAPAGTPYIIRSLSPSATLGGGRLLDLHPTRKSKLDPAAEILLQTLADPAADPNAKLALKLKESTAQGRNYTELTADLGIPATLPPTPDIIVTNHNLAIHRDSLREVQQLLLRATESFHQENPRIELGAPVATLRRQLPPSYARTKIIDLALTRLADQGALILASGAYARTAAFVPQPLTPDELRLLEILENTYRRAKLQPPDETAATKNDPVRRDLLGLMIRSEKLIAIPDRSAGRTHLFHPAALADLERRLSTSDLAATGFTVSDFTQQFNTTRKFAIPLLEYLDTLGKTRREGDKRTWKT